MRQHSKSTYVRAAIFGVVLLVGLGLAVVFSQSAKSKAPPHPLHETGTIMRMTNSCGHELSLAADGSVIVGRAVGCDGGSFVFINGKSIMTSSGSVAPQKRFSKPVNDLQPGDEASVTYINDGSYGPALNCATCTITKLLE